MAISQQWFGRSAQSLARWRILAVFSLPTPKISTFSKSKMPAAAILTLPYLTCGVGAYSSQRWGHIAGPIAQPHTNPKVRIFSKWAQWIRLRSSGLSWYVPIRAFLHSIVAGHLLNKCKPSWKIEKMTISQQRLGRSPRNLARWRILLVLSLAMPKISKFWKSKMAAAAILKNRKMTISPYLSNGS